MIAAQPALQIIAVISWLMAVVWLAHAITVVQGMATLPDVTEGEPRGNAGRGW
jgi:hypothetical protein